MLVAFAGCEKVYRSGIVVSPELHDPSIVSIRLMNGDTLNEVRTGKSEYTLTVGDTVVVQVDDMYGGWFVLDGSRKPFVATTNVVTSTDTASK